MLMQMMQREKDSVWWYHTICVAERWARSLGWNLGVNFPKITSDTAEIKALIKQERKEPAGGAKVNTRRLRATRPRSRRS